MADGEMLPCAGACNGALKPRKNISTMQRDRGSKRKCQDCARPGRPQTENSSSKGRVCASCSLTKSQDSYDKDQWSAGAGKTCKDCVRETGKKGKAKEWGMFSCGRCKKQKKRSDFSTGKANKLRTKSARCDACLKEAEDEERRVNTCGKMVTT